MTLGFSPAVEPIDVAAMRPTSVMAEHVLFAGLRAAVAPVTRTVACACGGELTAIASDQDDIREAVAVHNESMQHRQWAAALAGGSGHPDLVKERV